MKTEGDKGVNPLKEYITQMINSKAEYDKKPLKKILKKLETLL